MGSDLNEKRDMGDSTEWPSWRLIRFCQGRESRRQRSGIEKSSEWKESCFKKMLVKLNNNK